MADCPHCDRWIEPKVSWLCQEVGLDSKVVCPHCGETSWLVHECHPDACFEWLTDDPDSEWI